MVALVGGGRTLVSPLPSPSRCLAWRTLLRLAMPRQGRPSLIKVNKKGIFVADDLGLPTGS